MVNDDHHCHRSHSARPRRSQPPSQQRRHRARQLRTTDWCACAAGRATFERALADPDTIVDLPYDEDENDFGDAESFGYVADEVYEERAGEEPPDLDEDDDFDNSDGGLDWYDEATLRTRFPRLHARAAQFHRTYLQQRQEILSRWGA